MKKLDKRWTIRMSALAVSAALLGTAAALAAGGSQEDPLVTLSYLNQTAAPQIVKQVEAQTAEKQKELEQTLTALINQYKQQAGSSGTSTPAGTSNGYTLVTLSSGQVLALDVGCEVLLRVGTAAVQADSSPALIDLTTGGTIETRASLTKNHLYMATISDRTVTATAAAVKLLVRGGYTLR